MRQLRDGIRAGHETDLLGSKRMKKIVLVAAAAGLMSLAACNQGTPAENAGDMMAANLEAEADNMEAMADMTGNEAEAAALENAADNLEEAADNADDIGETNLTNAM
jgi:hypothetical protein